MEGEGGTGHNPVQLGWAMDGARHAAGRETASVSRLRGLVYGFACGVTFSLGGLSVRFIEVATPWQVVAYRSAFLGLAMLLLCVARHGRSTMRAFRAIGWPGLVSALILALANSAYVLGFLTTTIANALFLLSTGPVIAAVLGALLLRERVQGFTCIAIAGTVAGVLIMGYDGLSSGGLLGNFIALFAAFAFAAYTVTLRWTRGVDMLPALCLGGFFSAALGVLGSGGDLAVTGRDLALLAAMGGIQCGVGLLFMTAAARHILAAEVSLLGMAEAVLGPVWVWLVIDEVPTELTLMGGLIVLVSVFSYAIVSVRDSRRALTREAALGT